MNIKIISYSGGQVQNEILVATMEGHKNGTKVWWKPGGLLEVRTLGLGQDGKN